MISKNYKELDDTIRQRLPEYLYNGGKGSLKELNIYRSSRKYFFVGAWIHCAHIACIRNSIRPSSKQFPFIRELEDPTTFRWDNLLVELAEEGFL